MQEFNFHRPKSLDEAKAALAAAEEGKYLGGGQSLIPTLKLELAGFTDLVALGDIADLTGIREDGDHVVIGAGATHASVAGSEVVRKAIPSLAALAGHIGDPQVRNRGTLGGAIAHADPAADYPAAVLGLRSKVQTDNRTISGDDFFTGLFETALSEGEIVTAVHFEKPERACYAKFPNPASKYAIVGVMVAKYPNEVRVAVTGAGTHVFRAPDFEKALSASFSSGALNGVTYPSDGLNGEMDASPEYKAHLIGVMARRAVAQAI